MGRAASLVLAVVVVLVLLLVAAVVWYNFAGWAPFSFGSGAPVAFAAKPNSGGVADTSRLRFKKAVFTINAGGATYSSDVTNVLNGMASAYRGSGNSGILRLDRNLNPFSFVVRGVNSRDVVPNPVAAPWPAATTSLVGYYRTI